MFDGSFSQTDSTSLKGQGVDKEVMDSLGLVNPEVQKKYNAGVRALNSGNYLAAVQSFTECLLLDDQNIDAYFNRGMAFKGLKKVDDGIKDFDKTIELDPKRDDAAYMKAQMLIESERLDEGLEAYKHASQLNPKEAKYAYYQGVTLFQMEKYDEAIKAYTDAIQRKANYAYAYNDRGI